MRAKWYNKVVAPALVGTQPLPSLFHIMNPSVQWFPRSIQSISCGIHSLHRKINCYLQSHYSEITGFMRGWLSPLTQWFRSTHISLAGVNYDHPYPRMQREKKRALFYRTPWSYRKSANIKMHSKKSSVILSSCFSPTMSLTFPMGQFICRRGKRRRKLSNRAEGAITKYSAASLDPPLNTLNKHIKRKQKERTSLWLCSIFLNDFCYVIIIIVRGSSMMYRRSS